jgi:hypothetical protein
LHCEQRANKSSLQKVQDYEIFHKV